jgi:hypothetical protein
VLESVNKRMDLRFPPLLYNLVSGTFIKEKTEF